MVVELAERLGPSIDWWLTQPCAFALYCYYHLQDLDWRREWGDRIRQVQLARLIAIGFHDAQQLDGEYRSILADATSRDTDAAIANAERLAREIDDFDVLSD